MELTGWLFTDATNFEKCPRCGSEPSVDCKTPKGRRVFKPHTERVLAFTKKGE